MAGLTDEGLEIKRLVDVIDSLNTRLISAYGTEINLDEDSLVAQIRDLFAADIAEVWELAQAVDDAYKVDVAEGTNLDDLASLNKITRLTASPSLVNAVFKGDVGTSIPATTIVSVEGSGEQFTASAATVLGITPAYETELSVATLADVTTYTVTLNGTPYSYVSDATATLPEISAGLKAAIDAGSEPVTVVDNLDGSLVITADPPVTTNLYTLNITPNLQIDKTSQSVPMQSVDTGPILAPAGKLTVLETPIFGVDSVTNPEDETTGRNQETDTEFRIRRNESLAIAGVATLDSIVDKVGQITGVIKSVGFENTSLITDVDGRPAKSFEIIVQGGANATIGQTIWNSKPAGIESYGDVSETITDASGTEQTVKFSRPTEVDIYVQVDYTIFDEEVFPDNGQETIEQIVLETGQALDLGEDVIPQRFVGPIYAGVTGIENLVVKMDTSASPTSTTKITIDPKEVSAFDAARIDSTEV